METTFSDTEALFSHLCTVENGFHLSDVLGYHLKIYHSNHLNISFMNELQECIKM
jgi:hypothetical protein